MLCYSSGTDKNYMAYKSDAIFGPPCMYAIVVI